MLPDSPEQNLDEPMPDPTISVKAMQSYGYTDEEMLPLSKDRALELAERDVTVYLLYGDNTEAMALDDREIVEHDGLFGITREDWDAIKADIPLRDVEKRFMQNPEDGILIYQLKETAPAALWFAGFDRLQNAPDADNYKAVYTQPLYDGGSKGEVLEQAYQQFNIQRPADFTGHSLSVSDIVAIKRGPDVSYHYCDNIGFKELPAFRPENYLKAAEMAMEDDYGMIDGIIN
ncbi:YodL domain-containing protein, partial [Gemmiger formicilis]